MNDPRYQARYAAGRRSPVFSPTRVSMPSVSYASMYGGDIHVLPVTTNPRFNMAPPPRPHYAAPLAPPSATRTYALPKEPVPGRSSSVREASRNRRASTLDSTAARPVIVTTTTNRPHGGSSHATSSGRAGSPIRDEYRASEDQFWAQPASSIRPRNPHRNSYSAALDNDDFARLRDRTDSDFTHRGSRSSQSYLTGSRHNGATVDFEYEYTNPSDLARWDLDHDHRRGRLRESIDRGYYRPSISFTTTEHPNMNDISSEVNRVYHSNSSRPYDTRGGPPPTTWGLNRLNGHSGPLPPAAGIYDVPTLQMPVPPAAPAPPLAPPPVESGRRGTELVVPGIPVERRTSGRRPVSLYQETPPRSSQPDDFYRSRDDEKVHRDRRERVRDRGYDLEAGFERDHFDNAVANRGFGLRTESMKVEADEERDRNRDRRKYPSHVEHPRIEPPRTDSMKVEVDETEHRETRRTHGEPKRRSDEDIERVSSREEDERGERRKKSRESSTKEEPKDRRESKGDEQDDHERKRFRDKVTTGLGIAASAIGLGDVVKSKDEKADKDEKASPRRRGEKRRELDDLEPETSQTSERYKLRDRESEPMDRRERTESITRKESPERRENGDSREKSRREAEVKLADRPSPTSSRDDSPESDEGRVRPRRKRPVSAFNPTDAQDLRDLKEQLAAMRLNKEDARLERPITVEPDRESDGRRSPPRSPAKASSAEMAIVPARDDSRGRELVVPAPEEKQVRLVSPPRDKAEAKPIKGILKQPSAKFPEERNPIREGVAPHKDDKKLKEVPVGARWTKINRKVVNPEALTIGKERFEVRDDFIIVLRVLNKEEIQAYANATTVLRERRRQAHERAEGGGGDDRDRDGERDRDRDGERDRDRDGERDRDRDDGEKRRRRRHRKAKENEDDDEEDERDREYREERRRRHRRDDGDDDDDPPRSSRHEHHHHRSHRERDAGATGPD